MPASSASARPRGATGSPGLLLSFLSASAATFGRVSTMFPTLRRDGARQQAQDEAVRRISHLLNDRVLLRTEREILAAELKEAQRLHRETSSIRERLGDVTTQLLRLEGPGGAAAPSAKEPTK